MAGWTRTLALWFNDQFESLCSDRDRWDSASHRWKRVCRSGSVRSYPVPRQKRWKGLL